MLIADGNHETDFDLVRASMRLCSGLSVHAVTADDLTRFIRMRLRSGASTHVVTVNPEIEQRMFDDSAYATAVGRSDVRTCDGVGVQLVARICGSVIPPRTTGVALTESLVAESVRNNWTVMIIGADQRIRLRYEAQLKKRGVRVFSGTSMHITSIDQAAAVIAPFIRDNMVVLVALGVPKQELLINALRRLRPADAAVYVGVGEAIDYLCGAVRYAPPLIRELGFEWLFRIVTQWQQRLLRQLSSLPRFALREITAAILRLLRCRPR